MSWSFNPEKDNVSKYMVHSLNVLNNSLDQNMDDSVLHSADQWLRDKFENVLASPQQTTSLNNNDFEFTDKNDIFTTANASPERRKTPTKSNASSEFTPRSLSKQVPERAKKGTMWSPFSKERSPAIPTSNKPLSNREPIATNTESPTRGENIINTGNHSTPDTTSVQRNPNGKEKEQSALNSSRLLDTVSDNSEQKSVSPASGPNKTTSIGVSATVSPVNQLADTVVIPPKNVAQYDPGIEKRARIRQNLFVPLPEKDPLTVRSAAPVSKSKDSTKEITTTYPLAQTPKLPKLERKPTKKTPNSNPVSQINNVDHSPSARSERKVQKSTGITKENQTKLKSPLKHIALTNSSVKKSPNISENVFDRLSSLSTKSFKKKVQSHSKPHTSLPRSSIDFSGSPMRRHSPPAKRPNQDELSMQETLKDIFSTSKTKPRLNLSIPKKKESLPLENDASKLPPVTSIKYPVEHDDMKVALPLAPSSPNKENFKQVNLSISPGIEGKSPVSKGFSVSGDSTKEGLPKSNNSTEKFSKSTGNAEDRKCDNKLTEFQFLPRPGPDKEDVKARLNKRLSEVLRTQHELGKRRKEQRRKKSQLEDDLSKRSNVKFSDFKNYSKKHSLLASSEPAKTFTKSSSNKRRRTKDNRESTDPNSVLAGINSIDYRNKASLKPSSHIQNKARSEAVDDSLPEILSDPELDTVVLSNWAKESPLRQQLVEQENWDTKKIFGPLAPLHIEEIFPTTSRLHKYKTAMARKTSWKS
ncbi:Sli15p KNAG_0A03940 [Huiozyma naganishii CBS 8797]|uniref:Inner centromere protein ARK-binding domain-containing protein n=1 Tax=Huiozyma naganishii (strain ATCC MYA-139 / BCRC 22969 / CBS 8797 / KCTC 17520 / NBRC 10181 / NCYC 3082 / Yp74L-3) TaxID=1071383 RepID=J7RET7_HUIN7|nr:hypothetical protein KNAG_0A03940 [Kazachstania naganishii CBS 8797]CCK68073.1 hypothetical protein KNAG_0A03940 [Kazachstania naganishii CBS 8797]